MFGLISSRITRVICVSQGVKDEFIQRSRLPVEKVAVIPNGLDPAPFEIGTSKKEIRRALHLPEDDFLFGMVARLRKAKDHCGLISAFARIKTAGINARLVLVGDGPLETQLRNLVHAHGLSQDIIFLGRLSSDRIPLVLNAFDVFVHPTWREGMPAAILEAMACGLPIIATDAEGVTDIFDTSRPMGKLLPRGQVDLLAEAMKDLYAMPPSQRAQMGREARARLNEAFTHTHMVANTVALYNRHLVP
jgi:glycosyltransferase involved in cell wall biosynthesis